MDAKNVGGVVGTERSVTRDNRGGAGRPGRRGAGVNVEALEGRTLLSTTVNDILTLPNAMQVGAMTTAPDATLYIAEQGHRGGPALAKVTATGRLTEFVLPASDSLSAIGGLAADPSGNIWFSLPGTFQAGVTGKVGKLASDGTITEYPMAPGESPGPVAMLNGNLYVVVTGGPTAYGIEKVAPDGTMTRFDVPGANSQPLWVTPGHDGNLWFVNQEKVAKMTPTGTITQYSLPAPADGSGVNLWNAQLTPGSDGNIWFLGLGGISKITPDGVVSTIPAPGGRLTSLASGTDGNLWITFVPTQGSPLAVTPGLAIARVTTAGQSTVLDDRFGSPLTGSSKLAAGIDASIWIDEGAGTLGRLNIASVPSFDAPIVTPINKGVLTTDAGKTVNGRIATFQPTDPGAVITDFSASIDWNDGTVSSGTIAADPSGGFDVLGTHTYNTSPYGVQKQANITITGKNGASATIFAVTNIVNPAAGGPTWQHFPTGSSTGTGTPSTSGSTTPIVTGNVTPPRTVPVQPPVTTPTAALPPSTPTVSPQVGQATSPVTLPNGTQIQYRVVHGAHGKFRYIPVVITHPTGHPHPHTPAPHVAHHVWHRPSRRYH